MDGQLLNPLQDNFSFLFCTRLMANTTVSCFLGKSIAFLTSLCPEFKNVTNCTGFLGLNSTMTQTVLVFVA